MVNGSLTRTVMVALGDDGAKVLLACRRRLGSRMGEGLPIGMVMVGYEAEDDEDEARGGVVSLPLDFEPLALEGAIMAVLRKVSAIRESRSSGVDVIFVSNPHDCTNQGEVSEQVFRIIEERLGTLGRVMNLFFLPDPLANGVKLPVPDEATCQMIRALGHPCLLFHAVNREGFRLAAGRHELAAEILVQLSATPLGDALWQLATEYRCVAVGLAVLVYPAATSWQVANLARQMAGCWLGTEGDDQLPQVEAFLLRHELHAHQVVEKVIDSGLLVNERVPSASVQLLDGQLSEQLEQIQRLGEEFEGQVDRFVEVFEQQLEQQLNRWLADPVDYRLCDLMAFCVALQTMFKEQAASSAQRAEPCYKRLSLLDDRKGDSPPTVGSFELKDGQAWWRVLLRPHRWLAIWRAWRRYEQQLPFYRSRVRERLALTRQLLRYDLEGRYLAHVLIKLGRFVEQMQALLRVVREAETSLAVGEQEGEVFFDLEWSLAAHLDHEALAAHYVPSPKRALASFVPRLLVPARDGSPLPAEGEAEEEEAEKAWFSISPDEMVAQLEEAARVQLGALEGVGLSEVLSSYVEPEVRKGLLLALLAAAVPFSGTAEGDMAAQETVLLGVPSRTVGAIEALLLSSSSPVQVVPGGEGRRMTALRVVRV